MAHHVKGGGEGAWSGGGRPLTGASLPLVRQAVAWEHAEAVEAGDVPRIATAPPQLLV